MSASDCGDARTSSTGHTPAKRPVFPCLFRSDRRSDPRFDPAPGDQFRRWPVLVGGRGDDRAEHHRSALPLARFQAHLRSAGPGRLAGRSEAGLSALERLRLFAANPVTCRRAGFRSAFLRSGWQASRAVGGLRRPLPVRTESHGHPIFRDGQTLYLRRSLFGRIAAGWHVDREGGLHAPSNCYVMVPDPGRDSCSPSAAVSSPSQPVPF